MALPDPSVTATLETEEQCIAYLESLRWPHGVLCPNCGNQKISRFQARGKSGKTRQICQCLNRECKYQFSATTGTIFHDSHLPLSKWYEAMRLLADPATATPVNQLRLVLGVQYKTAKNVAERIRLAMAAGSIESGVDGVAAHSQAQVKNAVVHPKSKPARTSASTTRLRRPRIQAPPVPVPPQPSTDATRSMAAKPAGSPTVVDSMLSVFTSAMNLSVKPPLAAVNYLKKKILD